MTHWKQNFDYRFTGAYEMQPGQTKTVKIIKTGHDEVMNQQGKKEKCFVAFFENEPKPMVLNKTNCKTIEKLYGAMVENWIGKSIVIYSKKVKAFGEEVEALRIQDFKPVIKTDTTDAKKKIEAAKTADELKNVWLALTKDEQAQLVSVKDSQKLKIEGGQK